ncbi:hotdog family protein [Cupriavidus plantarum]|uniref:Putative hotdog family 3-hydroxylacyl-ACP dehydratase n=1 Tax=Cupriavidus plantarum TaxID=942865 RepID=A0A316EXH8_9BURK|nr:hotdog family protein [Cupriavidus plantarum]NYH98896.1 putative hotdog family 3-hydroxylacyl-ACP dehydratase [Cupriavidus plantarum]PWK37434.1 putative hotdog family 3-hydroxylacyl-ACP dehydratase [Cupriavidus plantarum]
MTQETQDAPSMNPSTNLKTSLPPVRDVVPHGGAMLLLDALVHADDTHCVARAEIRGTQLFVDASGMPAWVGIEYMAQTIAAWSGMRDRLAGKPPGVGFLLGSRRYECDVSHFPIGSTLTVHAQPELIGDNGLGQFSCRIDMAGREVARANVSVFQPADAQAFLQGQEV